MRSAMSYFTGTNLACLISASCLRIDRCSTLCCLIPKVLHNSCILISLQQPSDFFPHQSISWNHCWKILTWPWNYNLRPWPIQWIYQVEKYFRCSRFDEPLHNGYIALPQDLSTVVSNNVSKLYTINTYGGVPFQLYLYCSLGVVRNYIFSLIWRCYGPKRDILDYGEQTYFVYYPIISYRKINVYRVESMDIGISQWNNDVIGTFSHIHKYGSTYCTR